MQQLPIYAVVGVSNLLIDALDEPVKKNVTQLAPYGETLLTKQHILTLLALICIARSKNIFSVHSLTLFANFLAVRECVIRMNLVLSKAPSTPMNTPKVDSSRASDFSYIPFSEPLQ